MSYAFVPGEVVLLVEYAERHHFNFGLIQKYIEDRFEVHEPHVEADRVLHFTRAAHTPGRRYFSLVFVTCEHLTDEEIINGIFEPAAPVPIPDTQMLLVAVNPNWLTSAAPNVPPVPPDQGGGGGPGTKPVPDTMPVPPGNVPTLPDLLAPAAPWDFALSTSGINDQAAHATLQAALDARAAMMQGTQPNAMSVAAFILDVAPPPRSINPHAWQQHVQHDLPGLTPVPPPPLSLVAAYNRWHQHNPLLKSLLEYNGGPPHVTAAGRRLQSNRLRIFYEDKFNAALTDPPYSGGYDPKRLRKTDPPAYPYWAMDHGTFIAGIIHTLAPTVRLYLIEVLNAYGYGTLETLGEGLIEMANQIGDPPTIIPVVNMSLVFPGIQPGANGTVIIEKVCEWISGYGVSFAAAGNESDTAPYFPANLPTVHAVAALDATYTNLVPYSNQAPGELAAPGGEEAAPNSGWADAATGMLGLYIGGFPDPNPSNTNPDPFKTIDPATIPDTKGWGRWSGTSFATPVVAGMVAQLLASGRATDVPDALTIIEDAFSEPPGESEHLRLHQP